MDAARSRNPNGCYLLVMERMLWIQKRLKKLPDCLGNQILLSIGMESGKSPNHNGRDLLVMEWMP